MFIREKCGIIIFMIKKIKPVFICLIIFLFTICISKGFAGDEADKSLISDLKLIKVISGSGAHDLFNNPQAVFIDPDLDEIYIADTDNNRVLILGHDFELKNIIGPEKGLELPVDVALDKEDNIYVVEAGANALKVFDLRGNLIFKRELILPEQTEPLKAGRIFFDKRDNLYVLDRSASRIVVFDQEGEFKFKFGQPGKDKGQFGLLQDIFVGPLGKIFVTNSIGVAVQVFSPKGNRLFGFGEHTTAVYDFSFPMNSRIDRSGNIWVLDGFRHNIKVFDSKGVFIKSLGTFGKEEEQLYFPVDMDFDSTGNLYVLEKGANRLQVFEVVTNQKAVLKAE